MKKEVLKDEFGNVLPDENGCIQFVEKELNIVTCGNCGDVFGHIPHDKGYLTCPYCSTTSDICDFPDLYYPPQHNNSLISIIK